MRVLAQLRPRMPQARLSSIVGNWPEGERLKVEAAAINLGDRLQFIPWLPQKKLLAL